MQKFVRGFASLAGLLVVSGAWAACAQGGGAGPDADPSQPDARATPDAAGPADARPDADTTPDALVCSGAQEI